MVRNHNKRIAIENTWDIKKKENTFITKGNAGTHSEYFGVPLIVVIRDMLNLGKTRKEVRDILLNQEVLVDGIRRKDHRFVVGFMDVISIPKINKNYRIIFNLRGKISLIDIEDKESKLKLIKIKGKSCIGKKIQLNLADGTNILVDKSENKVDDTLVLEIPEKKIKESLKFEKGACIMLTGGKHIGLIATVENIETKTLTLKTEKGEVFDTAKKHAYVVGKSKPFVKLN